jgi:hypothetical protein
MRFSRPLLDACTAAFRGRAAAGTSYRHSGVFSTIFRKLAIATALRLLNRYTLALAMRIMTIAAS